MVKKKKEIFTIFNAYNLWNPKIQKEMVMQNKLKNIIGKYVTCNIFLDLNKNFKNINYNSTLSTNYYRSVFMLVHPANADMYAI